MKKAVILMSLFLISPCFAKEHRSMKIINISTQPIYAYFMAEWCPKKNSLCTPYHISHLQIEGLGDFNDEDYLNTIFVRLTDRKKGLLVKNWKPFEYCEVEWDTTEVGIKINCFNKLKHETYPDINKYFF